MFTISTSSADHELHWKHQVWSLRTEFCQESIYFRFMSQLPRSIAFHEVRMLAWFWHWREKTMVLLWWKLIRDMQLSRIVIWTTRTFKAGYSNRGLTSRRFVTFFKFSILYKLNIGSGILWAENICWQMFLITIVQTRSSLHQHNRNVCSSHWTRNPLWFINLLKL